MHLWKYTAQAGHLHVPTHDLWHWHTTICSSAVGTCRITSTSSMICDTAHHGMAPRRGSRDAKPLTPCLQKNLPAPGTGRGTQEGCRGCQAPGPRHQPPTTTLHYHESGWSSDSWCAKVHCHPRGQMPPTLHVPAPATWTEVRKETRALHLFLVLIHLLLFQKGILLTPPCRLLHLLQPAEDLMKLPSARPLRI